jgi:acyl carrier protein
MSMSKEHEILGNVVKALCIVKTVDVSRIDFETRLIGDIGLESIDIIDFIFELEKICNSEVNLIDLFQSMNLRSEGGYSDLAVKDIVATLMSVP